MKTPRPTLTLPDINAKGLPQGTLAAPGPPRGAGPVFGPFLPTAAVYYDGFNFFHAIDDFQERHLKWLDLWKLSVRLVGKSRDLKRVVWCSAEHPDPDKAARWITYRDALIVSGVHAVEGHFGGIPFGEKQGDVNVAVHLISDAYENVFDEAFLVTADSDQAATARLFKEKFGAGRNPKPKRFVTVAPPNRSHSKDILRYSDDSKTFEKAIIEECLLPAQLTDAKGRLIKRPQKYAPPAGWLPSKQRKLALVAAAAAAAVAAAATAATPGAIAATKPEVV